MARMSRGMSLGVRPEHSPPTIPAARWPAPGGNRRSIDRRCQVSLECEGRRGVGTIGEMALSQFLAAEVLDHRQPTALDECLGFGRGEEGVDRLTGLCHEPTQDSQELRSELVKDLAVAGRKGQRGYPVSFPGLVAGWSTSNTRNELNRSGRRRANESRPAPRSTY
jgi:hypothetical protein